MEIKTISDEILRKIDIYVEETNYFSTILVPVDTPPDKIEELKLHKYNVDKDYFIDGKYVGLSG